MQFFAICVAHKAASRRSYLRQALRYLHYYHNCLKKNQAELLALEKKDDLDLAAAQNKIACLLAMEGAEPLDESTEILEIFFRLGLRSLSLTWNRRNMLAGSVLEESPGGLTRLGRRIIAKMQDLGIILDLAHLSSSAFCEALELPVRPPLVSHANARALCNHPRNLDDRQLRLLADSGGVIGLSYYPHFIKEGGGAVRLEELIDHFCHVAEVAGVEHLAIGSDFDGIDSTVESLNDASCHSFLIDRLYERGFQQPEVELITGANVRRIINENFAGRQP